MFRHGDRGDCNNFTSSVCPDHRGEGTSYPEMYGYDTKFYTTNT